MYLSLMILHKTGGKVERKGDLQYFVLLKIVNNMEMPLEITSIGIESE